MDPLVYQYTVGGVVFGVGMFYAWRQGYIGPQATARRNFFVAVGGLLFFLSLQSWLEYAPMTERDPIPYTGEPYEKSLLGTPLDYGIMITYFVAMLAIGTWFGRGQSTTKDFFFGGQRFSWWLIAFSLIATTIGSASFVKYSKIAYGYGIASSQTYLNDWFWIPLLLFGWLPILYFSRLVSIPEYFERRFDRRARRVATWLLLAYLIGYVGINLLTMGQALNILIGLDVRVAAALVAGISAVYVTFGGQTSVIMTDLFQGVMLLATGLVLLALGIAYLGGPIEFWEHLPRGHRRAFVNFNEDPSYHSVGIFWQDGIANSAMFYFLNQGMVMRLMAARTVKDSRKAVITMLLVLMPVAAVVVASGGWVGQALVHAGAIDPAIDGKEAFFVAADFLAMPGVFGLVMAALTAALMSTVDTLITAIAAIVVNDIYKPARPKASERQLLSAARISSVSITLLGVGLVPIFMQFGSIYSAHGAFTAAVTPPLVVALLFGVFWRRFTPSAAWWTMVGGTAVILLSIVQPRIIFWPINHGVPLKDVTPTYALPGGVPPGSYDVLSGTDQEPIDQVKITESSTLSCPQTGGECTIAPPPADVSPPTDLKEGTVAVFASAEGPSLSLETRAGWLAGKDQYKFMRAFFGILVCSLLGIFVTLFTRPRSFEELRGLVWGTVDDAIATYKGSPGTEQESDWASASVHRGEDDSRRGEGHLPVVRISKQLAEQLDAHPNDLVYLSDARKWLGGLRASHAIIKEVTESLDGLSVEIGPSLHTMLVSQARTGKPVRIKRLY